MATRTAIVEYSPNQQRNCVLVAWAGLLSSSTDVGSAFETGDFADFTVQIGGTFGTGGSVTFEGSNDGTTWLALTDPQGNAVTKTAAAIEVCEEAPRYVRPNCTAGDGTTDITVTMWGRRGRAT